jgi:cob(I)alamin adenosyltransferase
MTHPDQWELFKSGEALGSLDELNATLGSAQAEAADDALRRELALLQEDLLVVGAELGAPAAGLTLAAERVTRLEHAIDAASAALPPLTQFILPGGTRLACALHTARATCRRAERRVVSCHRRAPVNAPVLAYLNRAADLLFVLARAANHAAGVPDRAWRQAR